MASVTLAIIACFCSSVNTFSGAVIVTSGVGGLLGRSCHRASLLVGQFHVVVERVRRDLHEYEIRTFDLLSRIWLELGNPGAALQAARRVVDLAPYRESAHARIMECHLAAGNRAEAIHTFDNLRRMLADSLGISPGPAAESLYEQALR
jgi:DNA-binding SARP family transcriptional activator